jgi:hypothetical protein
MDKRDWIFLLLCIFLVAIIIVYIYRAEVYKLNFEELCLKDVHRICFCEK